MNYTSELAKEIINRCGLSASVEKVWKTRGAIPDKYSNPDYQAPIKIDKAGKVLQDRIVTVLQTGFLNNSVILILSEVDLQKFADVQRGKSTFTAREVVALKKEINKARIQIIKAFEKHSNSLLLNLLKSNLFQVQPIFKDSGLDKSIYDKTSKFKFGAYRFELDEYNQVKDAFIKCAIQLGI